MASLEDAYRFTITEGIVTAVFEYDEGSWKQKSIDSGVTYALDPSDSRVVIKTEVKKEETKTERYLSLDGGQTYYELEDDSGESESEVEDDLYRFQFDASNNILSVSKFDDGIWKQVRLDANEAYKVDAVLGVKRVIKTEVERGSTKTEIYEDLDGDGDYVEVDSANKVEDDVYVGSAAFDVARGGSVLMSSMATAVMTTSTATTARMISSVTKAAMTSLGAPRLMRSTAGVGMTD